MTYKLLTVGNPKTAKGRELGYAVAVLHLAPYKVSGINVCPMAEQAACWQGCLNTSGRGGIAKGGAVIATDGGNVPDNAIQAARIRRTRLFADDRELFMRLLRADIVKFSKWCEREGFKPAVRLNGTSDILWEREAPELFETFGDVTFYDYTKVASRFKSARDGWVLPNYYLCLSYSRASERYASACVSAHALYNASQVIVVRDDNVKAGWMANADRAMVDGDKHDMRFLDPAGAFVILKAKGRAKADTSGFVID